jgi:L-aspartate oxidase
MLNANRVISGTGCRKQMESHTPILVIGCGIAGCSAALAAARAGHDVLMICGTNDPFESNTSRAQGGVVTYGPGDSPELLAKDITEAGAGMCNPDAVRFLSENGPNLLQRFLVEDLHVPFDKNPTGDLDLTEEGAHSMARILHSADLTGRAIIQTMLEAVKAEPRITLKTGLLAVDLLNLPDHSANRLDIYKPPQCVGAYVLETATGKVKTITANQTILATGGLGQIFLHTTNAKTARGDGIALAYRAGARLLNLEYIQFHPTALFHPDANRFLISESMRGEGGVLVNENGRPFMQKYHPLESLAPRDVVARAIQNEMLESGSSCMYLDIAHKRDADWIRKRFPNIYATCFKFGIDISHQPIPVVPAAHYSCGGVAVDCVGNTSLRGLRAVGEVSCTGLHGANRLASTSLLEGMLWGWNAGIDSARWLQEHKKIAMPPIRLFVVESEAVDPALIIQDSRHIKSTMWNYVGLTRTPRRLTRAMSILRELQHEILSFYRKARPSDSIIGLRNTITTALAVLFAAQRNQQSCGCHYVQED